MVSENGLLIKIQKNPDHILQYITHDSKRGGQFQWEWFYILLQYLSKLFNGLLMVKIGLTYAIAENNGQNHSDSHSSQSRALPGTIFRWLLELESPSGQGVSGQRTCGCGVNRPRCHGVTRGSCTKERCWSCSCFKKKMPATTAQKQMKCNLDKTLHPTGSYYMRNLVGFWYSE